MADYSGAWYCEECRRGGTAYTGEHAPECSVTQKIVEMAAARRAREEAEELHRTEQVAELQMMGDEDLVAMMNRVRLAARMYREQADDASAYFKLAYAEVRRRGLE